MKHEQDATDRSQHGIAHHIEPDRMARTISIVASQRDRLAEAHHKHCPNADPKLPTSRGLPEEEQSADRDDRTKCALGGVESSPPIGGSQSSQAARQ